MQYTAEYCNHLFPTQWNVTRSIAVRPTKSSCSSGSGKYITIVIELSPPPPAIAAGALIIGDSGCHLKLPIAVTCEGDGLRAPHTVGLGCEQGVALEMCVCVEGIGEGG